MSEQEKIKIGDLVRTTCYGARGVGEWRVGQIGVIVAKHKFRRRCFQVLLGKNIFTMNLDGLEVVSASR